MNKKEWGFYGAKGVLYLAILVFVFYRSAVMFLILLPAAAVYPVMIRAELKRQRLETLRIQFKDMILSVSSGLNAGYSVENAFGESLKEMERLHGKHSMICEELRLLLSKVRLNRTFEEALSDFAERSGLEDVQSFSDIFLAARGSGGELMRIIGRTAGIISEKMRIREDIMTATASRRMEQRFMTAIPILIVFYIELTSPGFFNVLYETLLGRLIMTFCLLAYLAACRISKLFLEIEV